MRGQLVTAHDFKTCTACGSALAPIFDDVTAAEFLSNLRFVIDGELTQLAFSERVGMPKRSFERVLAGNHKLSRRTAVRIVDALFDFDSQTRLETLKRYAILELEHLTSGVELGHTSRSWSILQSYGGTK